MKTILNTWNQHNYSKNTSIIGKKQNYELEWKILSIINKSKPGARTCKLCLIEALKILEHYENCINKGFELMNSYRHQTKYLLKNWKTTKT